MTKKNKNLQNPGQKYGDFELTRLTEIKELKCVLSELVHLPTGAHIMHIGNDDPENLFCLSFRTLPLSSNGVAHILEHTVLCGSKKFPIKDPFFSMNRRSLNTFMNALTGSDFTCYPAATQNTQDFYNLLDVYLDAVFHPNLEPLSFAQEGHRIELSNPDDPNSPLEYKGIVFNEMKGALSSADARLSEIMNEELFPDITYGYNSGGDPKHIPDLTYEELVDFHKTFYHASRCLFFFYGNLPLEEHLDFIEKHALADVEKLGPLKKPVTQPRFKEKKSIVASYPISSDEEITDKTLISFGWLTCNILQQEELLALSVVEIILMDTDASPLKRALLDSKLCKQVSCFTETDYTEIPLIITLRGCNRESADHLEAIIKETLTKVIKDGFSAESVENALHRVEFYRSEITGDHAPFGLSLFFRSGLIKQHGADPEHGLMIHSLFQNLRNHIASNPHYLTELIQKYMLDNTHFVRITMVPDPLLGAKEIEIEQQTLKKIRDSLSEEELTKLKLQAKILSKFQQDQEEEDLDVLPKVTLSDVDPHVREFELHAEKINNLNVFHHDCFTNEIVYADITFNLPAIEEKDLPFVRLFTIILTQIGAGGRNYIENLDYIQAKTGGISSSLSLNLQATDADTFMPSLHLHGKALHRYAKNLFEILTDTIMSADFTDKSRIKEILSKHYTGLQSSFNQNALKYAINLSTSCINVPGALINEWYGLHYYETIQHLALNLDAEIDALCLKMQHLQETLLTVPQKDLIITCDRVLYTFLKENAFFGLELLKNNTPKLWDGQYTLPSVVSQERVIASPVAFIGKVFKTIAFNHEDAAALSISSYLLDNMVLHQKIREQGGAYGGGAVCNAMAGNYYFYSYRDPNIVSTLAAFIEAIAEIADGNFDDEDLNEAKLEMIQGMDAPISPGTRGYIAYCWLKEGKTSEIRQYFRDKVLKLKAEDICKAVKNHIQKQFGQGKTIIFAGKELLEKEKDAGLKLEE
jgi:Zn-dependent M16 (insulinase) family peptidase